MPPSDSTPVEVNAATGYSPPQRKAADLIWASRWSLPGVNGVDGDLSVHRRRPILGDDNCAAELLELAAHLAHHRVTYRKIDRRVDGIDRPGPRAQLASCGCSHVHAFLLRGAGLPEAFDALSGLRSDSILAGLARRFTNRYSPITHHDLRQRALSRLMSCHIRLICVSFLLRLLGTGWRSDRSVPSLLRIIEQAAITPPVFRQCARKTTRGTLWSGVRS